MINHSSYIYTLPTGNSVFFDGFIRGLALLHYGAPAKDIMLDSASQFPDAQVSDPDDINKDLKRLFLVFDTVAKEVFYPLVKRAYGDSFYTDMPDFFGVHDIDGVTAFLWRLRKSKNILFSGLGNLFTEFSVPLDDLSIYDIYYENKEGTNAQKGRSYRGPGPDNSEDSLDSETFSDLMDAEGLEEETPGYDEEMILGAYSSAGPAARAFCEVFSGNVAEANFLIQPDNKEARVSSYYKNMDEWTDFNSGVLGDHALFLGKLVSLFAFMELACLYVVDIFGGLKYIKETSEQYKHAALGRNKYLYHVYLVDYSMSRAEIAALMHWVGEHLGAAVFLASDIFLNDPIYRGLYINKKFSDSTELKYKYAYDKFSEIHTAEGRRFARQALRRCADAVNRGKGL